MEEKEIDIILAEDNSSDAEMTIRALKKYNLTNNLIHLRDGVEILDFIFCRGQYDKRQAIASPKLVLLDLKMPKINGIEVLQAIRADERTKAIPVVILTSSKEDPDVQACYKLGANSYIVKPVNFDTFVKAVSDVGLYWLLLNQPPL